MSRATSALAWICILGQEEAQPKTPFLLARIKEITGGSLREAELGCVSGEISVSAEETDNTVSVKVVNNTYSKENGAPWSGVLFSAAVTLNDDDSMESVIERAVSENDYSFTVSEYGYISEINGLSEYAYNGNGGWMATLNNWFTSDGTGAYTVANGGLQAGDDIVMMYTCAWGADVGSLYGDFTTTLSADEFGFRGSFISEATTQEFFVPDIHEYNIELFTVQTLREFLTAVKYPC